MVKYLMHIITTYFFPDFFLSVAGPFDDFPEFYKLVQWYLAITVEINRVEKLIRRYFAESHLRPVPLRLLAIDSLISVLVKDLEHACH